MLIHVTTNDPANVEQEQKPTDPNGTGPHACYDCSKRFTSSHELKIHVAEHKRKKFYIIKIIKMLCYYLKPNEIVSAEDVSCGVCKAEFSNWYELQIHFNAHHFANLPCKKGIKEALLMFPRNNVTFVFVFLFPFVELDVSVPPVQSTACQHACDLCDESFTCKLSLKQHIQTQLQVIQFFFPSEF